MLKYLIYIVFILLTVDSYAQINYRFRNYTINDGLSQSSATTIIQDDLNALWIGTQDGLNRYDGKSFEIFTSDDTEGLESEYILCSHKDVQGNLWFGTSKGLTKYNLLTERFKTFTTRKGTASHIQDIAEDEQGNLWIATAESGVFKFDTKTSKFQNYTFLIPSKKTKNLEFSSKGILVVSTDDKGLFLCNTHQNKATNILINGKKSSQVIVNKLIAEGTNKILIGSNQGVFELNVSTKKTKTKFQNLDRKFGLRNVSDLYYEQGIGWLICTRANGLYILDEKGQFHHCTEDIFQKSALLFNELNTVIKDASGTFWIGSQRGLSSFNPSSRGILGVGPSGNLKRGIPTASVWSFDQGKQSIFIGTDKAVSRLDFSTGQFRQFERKHKISKEASGEQVVLALEYINSSKVLVGCADGLFELNISSNDYSYTRVDTKGFNRIYSIIHWKEDLFWVASKKGPFLFNIKTKQIEPFIHDPTNPKHTISKGICRLVYKDLNDKVWFTTSVGGLNQLIETDNGLEIVPYIFNSFIENSSTEYITSINQVEQDSYWLGTMGSGLLHWNSKSKKVTVYNKSNGLPNDVIYGVVSDNKNGLWLSTNKGVCNFNRKTKVVKNFTEADGLMSNEFNLGAYMITKEGVIYFGGIYGYNYFKPEELTSNKKDISVTFSKFKLDDNWLKPNEEGSPLTSPIFKTDELNLSYRQRSFTIAFQSSDLSNPKKINYKYILEGTDEGEIQLGSSNEIHFNALSYGTYTLKVYARSADGTWSSYPATLNIVIETPFWGKWWFWILMAAILAISVRIFIKQRIEASRREQVRLEMKVRDRTKEIQKQSKKIERQKAKIEEERNNVLLQQGLLQKEKDKTEKLLKNVIPASTAEELKKRGKARARAYKTVSVVFTDFVGFTKISDRMPATELVKKLDVYFTKFDEIIVRNNLEKIKTIGDAYMCAGGVPVRNNTNPIDACLAALQIQAYMNKRKNDAIANGREYWELRLGINTGEVTAGVIGSERLAFDVWGATVNHAQRMEMLGEAGKVTITGQTYELIEPYFECSFKGKAQTKSRGLIDMYVVDRIKPELSIKGDGIKPNEKFNQVVNLHHYSSINYYKAERYIMKVLETGLSKNLFYHSIAHTQDVVSAVERLALAENVTDEGLFLLKSAATYHDAGFVEKYDNNEPIGARLADEILPKYGYTPEHIIKIKELIYVTEIPHKPKNKLEEIICDADLDYLGRDDFHEIANKLRDELKEHGKIETNKQWDEIQVQFLKKHKYFTKTAKKTRNKKKELNLQEVIDRLEKDEY